MDVIEFFKVNKPCIVCYNLQDYKEFCNFITPLGFKLSSGLDYSTLVLSSTHFPVIINTRMGTFSMLTSKVVAGKLLKRPDKFFPVSIIKTFKTYEVW